MKRTTLDPTVAMTYPIAQSHTLDAEGNLQVDHHYADNTMHYPSRFVMSTVLDLANFAIGAHVRRQLQRATNSHARTDRGDAHTAYQVLRSVR
ncbi:MAG: hypothetical protein IPK19_10080 [Chloroflexi bacterium]|nr:hypothetical protein [Chloroflexota bacterium]